MAEHWMEILRPGTWNGDEFTPEYIRELQGSYDPEVIEAAVVIGHPNIFDGEPPAFGWAKKLEIRPLKDAETEDDISLWALTDLNDEGEDLIREKKYPKRSVGISDDHPYKNIPYLCHIALLGGSNPAVTKLEDVELAKGFQDSEGVLIMLSAADNTHELVWESKDTEYWYRVRPPARFQKGTFRSFDFKGVSGLRAVGAKYKPDKVPSGKDPDSLVIQALRFDKSNFSLSDAKAWVKTHKKELSLMSEGTIILDAPKPDKNLAAVEKERDTAQAKNDTLSTELQAAKDKAKKAEDELRTIELTRKETEYEHELTKLVEEGKGLPVYTEFGLHKALTAMDAAGIEVQVKEDGDPESASSIILKVLKAMPKVLEHREVSGAGKSGNETTITDPSDTRYEAGMQTYRAEGKSVVNDNIKNLTDKLMKEDPKLSIIEATTKASRLLAPGGN